MMRAPRRAILPLVWLLATVQLALAAPKVTGPIEFLAKNVTSPLYQGVMFRIGLFFIVYIVLYFGASVAFKNQTERPARMLKTGVPLIIAILFAYTFSIAQMRSLGMVVIAPILVLLLLAPPLAVLIWVFRGKFFNDKFLGNFIGVLLLWATVDLTQFISEELLGELTTSMTASTAGMIYTWFAWIWVVFWGAWVVKIFQMFISLGKGGVNGFEWLKEKFGGGHGAPDDGHGAPGAGGHGGPGAGGHGGPGGHAPAGGHAQAHAPHATVALPPALQQIAEVLYGERNR